MIKNILGLDLGVTSIGWAYVQEDNKNSSNNKIIKLGVRVNPLTVDEQINFEKGKPITTNAGRTLARSARRNLQRFKLRRANLIDVLKKGNLLQVGDLLAEIGKNSTFQTQELRAKSAKDKIELRDFARVLLLINKKRDGKAISFCIIISRVLSLCHIQIFSAFRIWTVFVITKITFSSC